MTAPSPNRHYDLQKARSILLRLAPTDLDVPMTRRLARALADAITLCALAPLEQITCRLMSQLEGVPERFRTSGVFSVLNQVAYAAWWGAEPATVELIWRARKWRLGNVRGWKNKTISALIQSEIERAVNAWVTATGRPRISKSRQLQFVLRQAKRAARNYPTVLSNQLRSELEAIRGKSVGRDFAYCIFEYGHGYIQYASDPWGNVYLCEIGSHRYVPEMEDRLNEKVFYLLKAAGFEWPKGRANFARRFVISEARDLDTLAKFSLAVLTETTGLSPADTPANRARIPFADSRLLPGRSFGSTVEITPSAATPTSKEKAHKRTAFIANEIARLDEQVEEIKPAATTLERPGQVEAPPASLPADRGD